MSDSHSKWAWHECLWSPLDTDDLAPPFIKVENSTVTYAAFQLIAQVRDWIHADQDIINEELVWHRLSGFSA